MTDFRKRSLRIFLGLGVCLPALMTPALAQDATEEAAAEEIIVTGSRIPTIRDQGRRR